MEKVNKKSLKNYVLGVNRINFLIYFIFAIVGIVFAILSFINTENNWCVLSGSLGASLIGAVLLAWSIDIANNIRAKERLLYIKNREIGTIFWGVKELFRLLYKEYLLISQQQITEGTEIKVCNAIDEMYVFYYTNNLTIDANYSLHSEIINWKKNLAGIVKNNILDDKRYFLDNDILTEDEFAGMERLYDFLLNSSSTLYDFDDYKSIINDTYNELKKINNYFFKIYNNNQVAIFSPEELKQYKIIKFKQKKV